VNTNRNGRREAAVVGAGLVEGAGGTRATDPIDVVVGSLVGLATGSGGTGGRTPISIVDDGTTVLGDIADVVTAQPVADSARTTITTLDEARTRSTVAGHSSLTRGYRERRPDIEASAAAPRLPGPGASRVRGRLDRAVRLS
jgi:hypothetical protein